MSSKKKKIKLLKDLDSFVPKINLKKININPIGIINDTKKKLDSFYNNLKKEREKEKKRLDKKRKLDQKREIQREKKLAQKERLDKKK